MIPRTRQAVLWLALVSLVCLSGYGFYSWRLFDQQVWNPVGLERLGRFGVLFLVWFAAISLWRPGLFAPLTLLVALVYTAFVAGPAALFATLFFLFSSVQLGRLLLPGMPETVLDDLLALLAGMSAYIFLIAIAVHFRVNYPLTYAAALAIPVLWNRRRALSTTRRALALFRDSGRPLARARGSVAGVALSDRAATVRKRSAHWDGTLAQAALGLLVFILLAHWLVVLKPEIGGDALAMHLAIPSWVANHQQWGFDFKRVVWAVMPMGADWSFTAVYLLGGEQAARLLNFGMFLVIAALLYLIVRRWTGRASALLAVALFTASPLVQLVTGTLMAENVWTAMTFGAIAALWRHRERREAKYLYIAAILLGSAAACKFGALAFAAAAGAWGIFEVRQHGWRAAALVVALLVLFGAQPYVTAYVKTGNPVFPFMNTVFKSPHFESAVPFSDRRFETPLSWRTLYDLTFHTARFMEGQDGTLGFHYLVLLPLALLAMRRKWPALGWLALAIAAIFVALTFQVQANLRYLYPALPLAMIPIALLLDEVRHAGRALQISIIGVSVLCAGLNIYFLPASSWYHKDFYLPNRAEAERYIESSAPVRKLVEYLNTAHPGDPVVFFESNHIAGLRAAAYTDSWHNEPFARRLRFVASPLQCFRLMKDLDVHFFIAPAKDSGIGIPQTSTRLFLSEFTAPERTYGRFYLARLKEEFIGEKGSEIERLLAEARLPAGPGAWDDFSPRIAFSEGWTRDQQFPQTANGTLTYSNIPGASFRVLFEGAGITYVYTRAPNRGIAQVEIDGKPLARVDLYAPAIRWQSATDFDGLGAGRHTLSVRILPEKNPASTETFVDVDSLIVR